MAEHDDAPAYIGIDLGGTKLLALVAGADGQPLGRAVTSTPSDGSAERVVTAMATTARKAMANAGVRESAVGAIGIASAGAIDVRNGTVVHSGHVPALASAPVVAMLRRHLDVPTVIGNDANLAAVGEHRFGAGRGVANLLFITVSTGIGGGIIVHNRLLLGAEGFAGEVGHITVDAHGPRGKSATPGAWEALCSGTALARIATERMHAGEASAMRRPLTARDVFDAYRRGDALARSVIADAIVYLGTGLTSLVNVLNPGIIIIGGGLSNEWDVYIAPAVALMREHSFAGMGRLTAVVPPALGEEAGALGAVALAQDAVASGQP